MKFKFMSFILVAVIMLSSAVGAHSVYEENIDVPSVDTYAIGGEDLVSPLATLCTLFGHADPVERNSGSYSQTKCISVGDDECQAICYRYKYCSRENCGENLGYASSGYHIRNGYCLDRMWDQYQASWVYDCTTCG